MKNVLLIGDSIRMGYDKATRKSLEAVASVFFPEDNCRFASYVLRYLHEYKALVPDGRVDVLHWNAGLWDCLRMFDEEPFTPMPMYAYYIDQVCRRIKKLCPEAKVIFATSTSVIAEEMGPDFKRTNEEIEAYNRCAVDIVTKYGFTVNDLYATSAKLPKEAHSDAVHYYTTVGTETFANQVISFLAEALGIEETITYREELYTDKPIGI